MRRFAMVLVLALGACVGGTPTEPITCAVPDTVALPTDGGFEYAYEIVCPGVIRTTTKRH